ncbi:MULTISPECIES: DUF1007 family protein [unclassified Oleiphilus]|uniref:DUF1007 family protein n=1 Tax=unclassified Oleiphilus TaxID=2631174 RepID=UPI0007C2F1B4|nr:MULTISPECIES: DUF1007 family protein [unclassified Oleiphilus]KZY66329.1 hypothetical protein A3738_17000 [Oleiphilus sp. HI0066]KZY66733.1 hypothetical protein A3738_00405 [Oleiphilus sp. HI0066]KZY70625.1 hypothetical protein A3739_06455 [Oleiphilus sp. HI0067]MCH2158493.1 DUF1007 family protein [Oleiphilaceae bacterium]
MQLVQKYNKTRLKAFSIRAFVFALLSSLSSTVALAHPHNWISIKTQFLVDADNRLIEIQQSWEFDAIYSMITSASLKNAYDDETVGLKLMAEDMRKNLARHNYFSNLIVDGNNIDIPRANQASLRIEPQPPVSFMTLDFTIRFENPINLDGKKVVWSVYDPTYYIAMNHKSVDDISIVGGLNLECGKDLVIPNPTEETIAYANSLDQSRRDTDGLGDQFAERAVIQCI